jgi:hypothetical protein
MYCFPTCPDERGSPCNLTKDGMFQKIVPLSPPYQTTPLPPHPPYQRGAGGCGGRGVVTFRRMGCVLRIAYCVFRNYAIRNTQYV